MSRKTSKILKGKPSTTGQRQEDKIGSSSSVLASVKKYRFTFITIVLVVVYFIVYYTTDLLR